ncbi:phosphatase PAP2 family protein [Nocardia arizonensis]|uniref:phosphatase PAP2 family protein n=1 Tax=Nocardia arizonensis TaxID=1141647 RepID=UPI0006D147DC|nr:phosphatase PAP2 family protein [Nocardia arizonensis]
MPAEPAPGRFRVPGLTALAIVLVVFVAALTRGVRHENGNAGMDPHIRGWILARRTETLNTLAHTVTLLGNTLTLTLITVVVCAGLLYFGHRGEAYLVATTGIGASVLTFVGKRLIGRSRPPAADRLATESSLSYPSGHSLGTMAVVGIVAIALAPRLRRAAARVAAFMTAAVFVVTVGLSRIYLGVHWPSDVLAGWSIGAAWILVCAGAYAYAKHRSHRSAGVCGDAGTSTGPSSDTAAPQDISDHRRSR